MLIKKKFGWKLENLLNTNNNESEFMSITWKCYRCDLTFRDEAHVMVHKDISKHPVRKINWGWFLLALKRITIMLDEDLLKKLRTTQAKLIKKNNGSVSLSRVINVLLLTAIKNYKV